MDKVFTINGKEVKVQDFKHTHDTVTFTYESKNYFYSLIGRDGHEMILDDKGGRFKAAVGSTSKDGDTMVIARGKEAVLSDAGKKMKKTGAHAGGLASPMPGKIFKILKEAGSEVKKGEAILILEAMKMEQPLIAHRSGVIANLTAAIGETVASGTVLCDIIDV